MKASHPNSTTPQAQRLIKAVLKHVNDPVKLQRVRFNLECHIHRMEVKAGAINEPRKDKDYD